MGVLFTYEKVSRCPFFTKMFSPFKRTKARNTSACTPALGKWQFHRTMVKYQKKIRQNQIGMLINRLNITQILISLVLKLLLNLCLYCPFAAHSLSKDSRSVKAALIGLSKTSFYKVQLYGHLI
jgi:hypothetical protein